MQNPRSVQGASPASPFLLCSTARAIRLAFIVSLLLTAFVLCSGTKAAATTLTTTSTLIINPTYAPPGTNIFLWGSGFDPYSGIDIYFDATHLATTTTDGAGAFGGGSIQGGLAVQVPVSAVPGNHWVAAIERSGQKMARESFLVRTDWAQDRFGPDRTGVNPYENVLNASNAGALVPYWSYPIGRSYSTPAVVNGIVYVGSDAGTFWALNAQTATVVWSYRIPNCGAVRSSPALSNGIVYFGCNDDNLYALDANTGILMWRFVTGGVVQSSPAVTNGKVYFGSADGYLYALNAATGALVWRYGTGSPVSTPAVASGLVYFSADNKQFAVRADTGSLLWQQAGAGTVGALANGMLYVSSGASAYALDVGTGAMIWNYQMLYPSAPAVAANIAYFSGGHGPAGVGITTMNALTGAVLWEDLSHFYYHSAPAVANGLLYFETYRPGASALQVMNTGTGMPWWFFNENPGYAFTAPVIADGVVYTSSEDGNLYAFHLPGSD